LFPIQGTKGTHRRKVIKEAHFYLYVVLWIQFAPFRSIYLQFFPIELKSRDDIPLLLGE
jgi:hypothetical protein